MRTFVNAVFLLILCGGLFAAAPLAADDLHLTAANTSLTCYPLVNDSDADGDILSLQSFDSASAQGGVVTDNGDGTLTYSPPSAFAGLDTFGYTVTDGGSSASGTVSINVNAVFNVNDARNNILSGVSTLGNPSSPGWMVVFGETAYSVGNYDGNDHREPLIGGGTLGQGRILAMPDHQWLNMDSLGDVASTGSLYTNGLTWLSGTADKSIKIVVTPNSSAVNWLTSQGYTNVVQSSNYAVELADADVLVGWLGSSLSESNIDIITDFIRDGGGLFVCDYGIGYSWWWGKDLPDVPSNRIMRGAGIAFTGEWPGGSLVVDKATGQTSSEDVIGMLEDSSGYSSTELEIGGKVLDRMYQVLPEGDTLLARLDEKFYERIDSIMPTPATPVSDSFEKALIKREASILQNTPFDEVVAHRTAEAVYGAIPVGAERVSRLVSIDTAKTRWHSTGLYAAPGELVTVTVPAQAVGQGFNVRLSGHVDNISSRSSWNRIPYGISRTVSVDSTTVQIASAFGGAVYFDVGSSQPGIADFDIQIDGVIEAPYFVLGETTNAQWVAGVRDNPAPFVELVSDHLAISFPSQYVRTVDDMEAVMQYWDQVVSIQDYVGALESFRTNAERINIDVQISVGWLHAGYPVQGPTASSTNLANLDVQLATGDWGWFHELGHESQRRPDKAWGWDNYYTFPGDVEVTVNIFASASLEGATNNVSTSGWGYSGYPGEVMSRAISTINDASNPNFDNKDAYPFYFQLADGFDWSTYRAVFQTYHDDFANDPGALPSGGQEEKDQWLIRWSQVSGYNMVNYMVDHWKLEVTSSAISQVNALGLPDWLPVVTSLRDIEILPEQSHVFDIEGSAYSLNGAADVISVELPSHGSFTDNGDGTWTYVAGQELDVTDSFSFTLQSSVGNTKRYTVNISIVDQGALMETFTGIGGNSVSDLTDSSKYPDSPDEVAVVSSFEAPSNRADNFGTRMSAWLTAPVTGSYTFWIASDDNSELWLSTDPDPANVLLMASVPNYTSSQQWDKYPEQQSSVITLTAGVPYYIMALQKEGSGGDNLAVAWSGPGITQQVISGSHITPYYINVPTFSTDPIIKADALEGYDYNESIADSATAADGGTISYSKTSGPFWLSVAADGPLSGVPGDGDVGNNTFTVTATDSYGYTTDATLQITVLNTFTGELGLTDFAALAARWLDTGCTDTPPCGGADLTGDNGVNIDDLAAMGNSWLIQKIYGSVVSIWPFDTDASDMASGHDGTLVNGASINTTDSIVGIGALELDGIDDYVAANAVCGDVAGRDVTFAAWVRSDVTGVQKFVCAFNTSSGDNRLLVGQQEANANLMIYEDGWQDSGTVVFDGTWHHVAFVLSDSVDEMQLFVDGEIVHSYSTTTSIAADDLFSLGQEYDAGLTPSDFFDGQIDDVRIYNEALGQEEIQAVMNE